VTLDSIRSQRWASADVDLAAVAHNVRVLRRIAAPAAVWAVVKANGYGHGAVRVARAALQAGAEGLCVAIVAEGVELRAAGIDAPILLLAEHPPEQSEAVVEHRLTPAVYTHEAIAAMEAEVRRQGRVGVPVQLKVDTGMHRVGAQPGSVAALVQALSQAQPWLRLNGAFTHLAVSDEPDNPFTSLQLQRFAEVVAQLPARPPYLHAANSGGALAHPSARLDLVRAGITVYGLEPGPGVRHLCGELVPALTLRARVSHVKRVAAGDAISYGLTHRFERASNVATVPLGYADGVPRRMGNAPGHVLCGGRRRPIVGVVTMDQFMIDCGDDHVRVGDEVVLIGRQGDAIVRAEDWAEHLGTIGYEIVCGISARVPRHYASTGPDGV
jgi:alanine racemase